MPQVCNFIKKKTQAQLFSCKFCEISKNTFFYRTLTIAASYALSKFVLNFSNVHNIRDCFIFQEIPKGLLTGKFMKKRVLICNI